MTLLRSSVGHMLKSTPTTTYTKMPFYTVRRSLTPNI